MRKYISILFLLLITLPTYAGGKAKMTFNETQYDFGYLQESEGKVSHAFRFTNDGDSPLVITRVRSSCGCTTPQYSKRPVSPGQTDSIVVIFDPKGRPGEFRKEVTISTNSRKSIKKITIKGVVVPKQ